MIKVALFDVGRVLVASATEAITEDLSQELGLDAATIDKIWDEYIDTSLGCGRIDEDAFWKSIRQYYNIREVTSSENLLGRAYERELSPNQEVIEVALDLKQRGLMIAILSDTIEPHARALHRAGIYEPFDRLFLSHETGRRKPDLETFEYVVAELGVRPHQIVFVDDRPENIEAANSLGINGVVYTDPATLRLTIGRLVPQ